MFARIIATSIRKLPTTVTRVSPVVNNNVANPLVWAPQRSFGVFSSIKENLNEKIEEKKQKNQGLGFCFAFMM